MWLCNINEIGNATIRGLLKVFATPQEIYYANEKVLENTIKNNSKINDKVLDYIINSRNMDEIKRKKEYMDKKGVHFFSIEHQYFPEKLKNIQDYPYGLFTRGKVTDISKYLVKMSVAVVGARNCTAYGRKMAHDISFELAMNRVNIISGMARGIDKECHLGALDAGGMTFAVLGNGVDQCYPRENIELYENILDNGALISEYPPGRNPFAWQFPMRNRIISGLSDKILVVEARENSGSLITVEHGLEQGKDIYVIPGKITDELSKGCNRLIKEGAGVITSLDHLLEDFELDGELASDKKCKKK
ncbi:MAG: DNA-processing protein DprA [Lachnospiraceae bacterium]|nr:DNA-processing protein DprA [Lachnospiraceae bacterium]